jgi:hypothetical protein
MARSSSARSKAAPKASQPQSQSETWKPIPHALELFAVSDLGNVKDLLTGKRVKPYVKTKNGIPTGRLYVRIDVYGVRRNYSIARLVLAAFVGQHPTNFHEASHLDDNPANNSLSNLAWETRRKNLERRQLNIKGSQNSNAKLTTEYAYWIYRAYHLKEASIRQLASSWSIGAMTVSDLVNGKTWATFGFAEQLAQGNERYIDPAASQVATVTTSSGNPFLDAMADFAASTDTDDTTETTTDTTAITAQPFINWFTINADEMLAQLDAEDEDTDALILAPAVIEATAPTKPRRPLTRRF